MKKIVIRTKQDYKNLNYLPFNRQSEIREDLKFSMKKYGAFGTVLLIKSSLFGTKDALYVIDGQHRIKTAEALGLSIEAHILEKDFKSKSDIVMLVSTVNTTQKSWNILDFINAYASLGYSNYTELLSYIKKSPFTYKATVSMLNSKQIRKSPLSIYNGTYEIRYRKDFEEVCKTAKEAKNNYSVKMDLSTGYALNNIIGLPTFNKDVFLTNYYREYEYLKTLKTEALIPLFRSWMNSKKSNKYY